MSVERLLIDQKDITKARLDRCDAPELSEGEVRLKIDHFAMTANNVTYALAGFDLGYWSFFPSGLPGEGLLPVWGVAEAVESKSDAVTVGTRLYGFFPLSSEVVIQPSAVKGGIVDRAEHRAELPAVYNRYQVVGPANPHKDHQRALLQPLLATSYLLCDWLADNAFFGAEQIIVGSASSKTGLGLCKYLAELEKRNFRLIGLTSSGNKGFVESLNACDSVLTYDEIDTVPQVASVYVDMSGNGEVKAKLHHHLQDHMVHSAAVGISHWDKFAPRQALPGAKPQFFFAPAQVAKRREEWGPGVIEGQIGDAFRRIASSADGWLDVQVHTSLAEAPEMYDMLIKGEANPQDGHIIQL